MKAKSFFEIVKLNKSDNRYRLYIGLNLNGSDVSDLAIPGGENPDDYHVTLLYGYFEPKGDEDDTAVRIQTALEEIKNDIPDRVTFLHEQRFGASESSDKKDVIVARAEGGYLEKVHSELLKELKNNGINVETTFPEYIPHMTLAYIEPGAEYKLRELDHSAAVKDISIDVEKKDSKQTKIIHKTFSEILKFNENHDNLGRFTSGSSAGAVAASNSPQKAYALSEENKAYLIAYTSGKYGECCSISQKLEQGENVDSHNSNDVKQTKEIMKAIDSQPVTDSELVRIETGSVDYNSGDTFTWGIRSTSRDTDFAKKVINQEDAGTENKLYTHDGRYLGMVEYHIVGGKKALDVSEYSDFDQKESLVKGKFKVLSVDKTEYKPPERKTFEQAAKENPSLKNRYEEFTSKKGNAMVRDNETGTSYTKDKFGKMVYHGGKMISDHEFDDMVYDHKRSFKPKTLVKVEQVL